MIPTRLLTILLAGMVAITGVGAPAQSADQQWSRIELLPGWAAPDGSRMAGLRITLAPGWKTYWRAPQGSGIPPIFDWSGSSNLATAQVLWPRPEVFDSFGSRTLGYANQVVFPVKLTPRDASRPLVLDLALFYGVCEQVCMPVETHAALNIAPDAHGPDAQIRAALATTPLSAAEAGLSAHSCRIAPAPDGDGFTLQADLDFAHQPDTPEMVVIEAGREDIWISTTRAEIGARSLTIDAKLAYYGEGAFAMDRSELRLTLFGPGRALELTGCPAG